MNLSLANKHGAKIVCCVRHYKKARALILGDVTETETQEACATCAERPWPVIERKVIAVHRGVSNSALAVPYKMARLACGHLVGEAPIGDLVECWECGAYEYSLAKLKALRPGDVFRSRFRPYDSRGGSEGAYYIYRRDNGPSGVVLLFSIHATEEAGQLLSSLGVAPLSPTERA